MEKAVRKCEFNSAGILDLVSRTQNPRRLDMASLDMTEIQVDLEKDGVLGSGSHGTVYSMKWKGENVFVSTHCCCS